MGRPSISICIITNSGLADQSHRTRYLLRLLKSIEAAGVPAESREIIVCGAIPAEVKGVQQIKVQEDAHSGNVCRLRNLLVEASRGDIILHCDDDILLTRGYWEAVSDKFHDNWDILCTRLLNPNGTRYWDWAAHRPGKGQTLLPYGVKDEFVYATGGHALYRRRVFSRIRWSEAIRHRQNEEFQFAADAREAGLSYSLCENACVFLQYHHCDAEACVTGRKPQAESPPASLFCKALADADRYVVDDELRIPSVMKRLARKVVQPSADVSVLVCCFRYRKRLAVFVESLIRQSFNGQVELIVANPSSPDGLAEELAEMATLARERTQGRLSIREVILDREHYRNRGYCIQRAFENSTGNIVIGMDCDLVLPTNFLSSVVPEVIRNPNRVVGVYRNFLSAATTKKILDGALNPIDSFDLLSREDCEEEAGYRGVLGYCQSVVRQAWKSVGYPQEFDWIGTSDVKFVERLESVGVMPLFLKDVRVLHLQHLRDWSGTKEDL